MSNNSIALRNGQVDLFALRMDTAHPRLRDIEITAAQPTIAKMVTEAAIVRGASLSPEAISLQAATLYMQLQADYPDLTMEEVGNAIKAGCYGKYGEVYGVNPASLYKMVSQYVESEEKAELTRRIAEAKERANAPKLESPTAISLEDFQREFEELEFLNQFINH